MAEIKGIIQQRMPYGLRDAGNGHHTCSNGFYAGNWFHVDNAGHKDGGGTIKHTRYKLGVKKVGYKDSGDTEYGTNATGSLSDNHGYTSHIFKKHPLTGNHFYIRNKNAYHGVGGDLPHWYGALESQHISSIQGKWWTPSGNLMIPNRVDKNSDDNKCSGGRSRDLMCTACSTIDDHLCDLNIDKSNKCIGYNHGDPDDNSYQGGRNTDNDKYCMSGYKEVESQHGKERADAWCMAGGTSEWVDHRFSIRDNDGNLSNDDLRNRKCLLDSGDKEWECLNEDGSEGDTPITSGNNKNKTCKQLGNEYRADAGMFYAKILCDKTPECKSKRNHVMCNKAGGINAAVDTNKDDSCENEFNELKENNHYKTLEEEEEACRSIDGCDAYRSSFKTVGRVISTSGSNHVRKGCGRVISGLESDPIYNTQGAANWNYGASGDSINTGKGRDDRTSLYLKRYDGRQCILTFDGGSTTNSSEQAAEFYDYYNSKNDYLLKANEFGVSDTSFEKHNELSPYYDSGAKGATAFSRGGKLECKYNERDFDPEDPKTLDRIKEFKRKFPSSHGCILDDSNNINISCSNLGSANAPSTIEACKKYIECLGTTDGNSLREDDSNKCYVSEDERSCVDRNNQPAPNCHLYPDVNFFDDYADQYVFRDKYDDEEIKINTENFDKIMSKYCGKEKHDGKFCMNGASKCSRFLESNTQGGPLNDVGHFCHQWEMDVNQPSCHDERGIPLNNSRLNKLYESRGVNVSGHDEISNGIASSQNSRNGYCDKPENADAKECFCSHPENDPLWAEIDDVYTHGISLANRGCWYTNCDVTQGGKNTGNWVPPLPGIKYADHEVNCPAMCNITQNAEINIDGNANLSSADSSRLDAFNNKLSATCNLSTTDGTSTRSTQENSNPVTNPDSSGGGGGGSVTGNVNVTNNEEEEESFIKKHKVLIGASGAFTCFVIFIIILLLAYYYM